MNSDFPTIISFYTNTWEYPTHAKRLQKECEALGLDYHIKEYPTSGSWIGNTRIKASFIHDTLLKLQRPILWIDVDGSVYQLPHHLKLPINVDFMGRHQRIGPKRNWHVGTLFFNYNDKVLNFLNEWKTSTTLNSGTDEASFEAIWLKHSSSMELITEELPAEYFQIEHHDYNKVNSPIIVHRLSQCDSKLASKNKNKKTKI